MNKQTKYQSIRRRHKNVCYLNDLVGLPNTSRHTNITLHSSFLYLILAACKHFKAHFPPHTMKTQRLNVSDVHWCIMYIINPDRFYVILSVCFFYPLGYIFNICHKYVYFFLYWYAYFICKRDFMLFSIVNFIYNIVSGWRR